MEDEFLLEIHTRDMSLLSDMFASQPQIGAEYEPLIDAETRPLERFQLNPGQSMKARITFKVPPGTYQFVFG